MKRVLLFIFASLLCVGVKATELWTGSFETGDWTNGITVNKEAFASVAEGEIIKITISGYDTEQTTYWQYSLKQKDNGWVVLPNFVDGSVYQNAVSACHRLTADDVTALKTYGLAVQGHYITITKVELLTTTDSETIYSDATGVSTGNYEDKVDLAWSNKGNFSTALMNDFVAVTYAATGDGEVRIANPDGWQAYNSTSQKSVTNGNSGVFVFAIPNATILENIQQKGIIVYGKNITITKVELLKGSDRYDAVPLTVGNDGIATFGSSKHLDFSGIDDITPYYASNTAAGTVTLTSVESTHGWAGYIIKGTPGTYDIPVTATEPAWEDAFNNLRYSGDHDGNWIWRSAYDAYSGGGSDETNIKTKYRYIFAKKGSDIGFYKLPTNYSRVTTQTEGTNAAGTTVYYHILNRHKAYLETATDITPSGARIALIFDDDETTGVNEVRDLNTNVRDGYYDLQGRKVAQPTRGLYIVNGRKVIIK